MNTKVKYYIINCRKFVMQLLCFRQLLFAKRILNLLESKKETSESLNSFVNSRLNLILDSAKKNALYYKRNNGNGLMDLPVVDKSIIRENMDDFINAKCPFYNRFRFNTGGSTGEPFVFYTNRLSGYVDAAHQRFLHKKIGYKRGDKVFSIDGTIIPEDLQSKHIYWIKSGSSDAVFGSYAYSALSISSKSIPYILESFEREKPAILRGYPSAICEIAEFILSSGTQIDFQLKGIVLTAENIMEKHVHLLNAAFHAPVYGQYGHSEKCIFAYTEANTLSYTCSSYYGFVEILDENNNHVKIGEVGRIIVSSYYNDAMYFLRYDTGDLAEYGGVDKNGNIIFTAIIGRKQDFIYDFEKNRINITALIFGQHFHAFANILRWQIIQSELGKVDIKIIKNNYYTEKDESEIRNKFLLMGFEVEFFYVDDIALTPRGKYRLVQQKLNI